MPGCLQTLAPCPAAAAGLLLQLFRSAARLLAGGMRCQSRPWLRRPRRQLLRTPHALQHSQQPIAVIPKPLGMTMIMLPTLSCAGDSKVCARSCHRDTAARAAGQGVPLARWRRSEPQPSARAGCNQPSQAAAPASPPLQPPVCGEHIQTDRQPTYPQVMVAAAGRSSNRWLTQHRRVS